MPLAEALSRSSIRMPLAEANQLFINIYSFGSLVSVLTQYSNIHDRAFHKLTLWKRKVKITYLFHMQVVLVLMMVGSQPHHQRHQGPQISIFASLNHIHHYTYFKNPYVHVQVFHILHHHTMKLLQAFKSFLIGESIIENWQRKLICWWLHKSAAKTSSLQVPHNSAAKIVLLQPLQLQ